jgi:hypothetical protein
LSALPWLLTTTLMLAALVLLIGLLPTLLLLIGPLAATLLLARARIIRLLARVLIRVVRIGHSRLLEVMPQPKRFNARR